MKGVLSISSLLLCLFLVVERVCCLVVDRKVFIEHALASSGHALSDATFAQKPFVYSDMWTGTYLSTMSLEQASNLPGWPMGRWPDPVLRRPASEVDAAFFTTDTLKIARQRLKETALRAKAVGLAAQQCGVDARMVYLQGARPTEKDLMLINPHIVSRSDEDDMKVWNEFCLVLPPTFRATVLRDAWVDVDYQGLDGQRRRARLTGEQARAAQHELDHDRGILITDHVSMEELESDLMRQIEAEGHEARQRLAYERYLS